MKELVCIFLLFNVFFTELKAQDKTCEQRIKEQIVDKLKPYASNNLIPYYSSKLERWGYFDRVSGLKVTKPLFKEASFFKPYLEVYYALETSGEFNGCDLTLSSSADKYNILKIENSVYELMNADYDNTINEIDYSKYINDSISGFKLNNKDEIIEFNSKFFDFEDRKPRFIQNPIKLNNQYYSIILQNKSGIISFAIIDQKGNYMPGFEELPNYPNLKDIYIGENDVWFAIDFGKDQYKFKSLLNNKELPETFGFPNNWLSLASTIGYAILEVNNESGIMDLTTMQWKIKPSAKNNFAFLHYTSLEKLSADYIENYNIHRQKQIPLDVIYANRLKSKIFIQGRNNKIYDFELNECKPFK